MFVIRLNNDVFTPDPKTGRDAAVFCPACHGRLATWAGTPAEFKAITYGGTWPRFPTGTWQLADGAADFYFRNPLLCRCGATVKLPSHTVMFRHVVHIARS